MLRTLKSSFVALALLAVPAIAHAEEPTKSYPDCGREPTDAEVNAAKGAFQAGQASFNEADYARAIDYWEDAFRRDCTANPLLLNLARAYELAGRKRQAVVALETYLAREPNSGEKDQINRRIDVLKKKIAEEDATAAAAAPPPPTTTGTAPPPANGPEPVNSSSDKRGYSPWPWVLIGVGGAGTVLGVVGVVSNNKKLTEAENACPTRMGCDASITDKGNKARSGITTSGFITGAGALVAAGGVVWLIIDHRNVNQGASRLTPLVGQGFAGLSFDGSF